MKPEKLKLALAQMANAGSARRNLEKSLALLRRAAENGAQPEKLRAQRPYTQLRRTEMYE